MWNDNEPSTPQLVLCIRRYIVGKRSEREKFESSYDEWKSSRSLGFAHDFVLLLSFQLSFFQLLHQSKTLLAFWTFSLSSPGWLKVFTFCSHNTHDREYFSWTSFELRCVWWRRHGKHHHVRLKTFTSFMCHAVKLLTYEFFIISQALLNYTVRAWQRGEMNPDDLSSCLLPWFFFFFFHILN